MTEIRPTYQEEFIVDIWDEVFPMLEKHWDELANYKEDRPLDPDVEMYNKLNEMGHIKALTVRIEGKIVGYCSFHIANNLHYKTWKYAVCDVYYLDPAYRKTGLALEFFRMIEAWLKSLGVQSVTIQEKIDHPHEKLFNSLGFNAVERTYEKVLN